jgi:hypothetical protein
MAITSFTPNKGYPVLSAVAVPKLVPASMTLTTGGGVRTLTAAEVLGGLLLVNCDDAQTATLPTISLLLAAIEGPVVGSAIDVDVINTGDTTLTIAVGTGITALSGTVLTIVAKASKRFRIVVTGIQSASVEGSSNAAVLYGFGSVAAATA